MRRPSGDQAGLVTSKSPLVSWRGVAPARTGMSHRCDRRTTCPDSSSRKSSRVMRRAIGDLPLALLADDEAVVAGLRDQRHARTVRRPVDAADAVLERRELPRLAAVERQHPRLRDGIVGADRRAHEGQVAPVRRDRRRAVAHPPSRELARPPAAHRPQPDDATRSRRGGPDAGRRRRPSHRGGAGRPRERPGHERALWRLHRSCARVCTDSGACRGSLTRFRGMCHPPRDRAAVPPRAPPPSGLASEAHRRCDATAFSRHLR